MTCLSAAGRPGSTASKEDTKLKTCPYLQLLHLSVVHIYLSGTLSLFMCMLLVEPKLFSTVCGGKKCSRHLVSLSRALGHYRMRECSQVGTGNQWALARGRRHTRDSVTCKRQGKGLNGHSAAKCSGAHSREGGGSCR
jgi:hypothetical protein